MRSSETAPSAAQSQSEASLPDISNQLQWTAEEKLVAHRKMHLLFPSDTIAASAFTRQLPEGESLDVRYRHGGEDMDIGRYFETTNATGLIAVRDGEIVLERYAEGNSSDTRWASRSMAKSVTSTLIGIAIAEGFIPGVDTPVTRYLPELAGGLFDGLTIRHLLQMVSGLPYTEDPLDPSSDVFQLQACTTHGEKGAFLSFLKRLGDRAPQSAAAPGSVFNYSSADSVVLGLVLERATGVRPASYLQKRIWGPLGMERDAFWNLEAEGGSTFAASGLSATLRDYARFGLFILGGGALPDGEATLPDWWMEEAVRASAASLKARTPYGFQWWLHHKNGVPSVAAGAVDPTLPDSAPLRMPGGDTLFYALGSSGQTIAINPAMNAVIVKWAVWEKPSGRNDGRHKDAALFAAIFDAMEPGGGARP
ncbi:serine hydrolase domain-containing protein [Pikeienuella sp. HZG-20]|uniref:serine hydrolase domain-containing protein n=1 Tax=Paludibacillus litoralis TaxID=3133267 RepID=UPI0030ECCF09